MINATELKTAFPSGEYVRTECVRATIDHMPTIDAIPVDWLEAKQNEQKRGSALWWSIKAIIDTWIAEKEAQ